MRPVMSMAATSGSSVMRFSRGRMRFAAASETSQRDSPHTCTAISGRLRNRSSEPPTCSTVTNGIGCVALDSAGTSKLAGHSALIVGSASVSYTHLDVYKRQMVDSKR